METVEFTLSWYFRNVGIFLNTQMYGSMGWKNYFIYNHARAYMQDYTGMPDYEENEDFYQSIGVSENAQKVFKSYS